MTARLPEPPYDDALSADERAMAARVAKIDAATGPSPALDARILAAARAAASPRPVRSTRWPRAVGAAAVLVAAVGLAWQLRPMFELPPPLHTEHAGPGRGGAQSDVVVRVETVPRRAPPLVEAAGDVAAQPTPPAAPRRAAPATGGLPRPAAPPPPRVARVAAPTPHPHEFSDEAVPPGDARALQAESAPVVASPPSGIEAAARKAAAADASPTVAADGLRADSRLPLDDWFVRIRERRDAGDLAGARASLARLVAAHPRARIPADLRPLLDHDDPWSP